MSHARTRKAPLAFLIIDASRFKQINTRFGHLTGDFVPAEIAGLICSSTRGSDAVVSHGGDEFLVLLADITAEYAENVVGRIYDHIQEWNAARHLDN